MRHPAILALCLCTGLHTGCASRYEKATEAPAYAGLAKISVTVNKTNNRVVKLRVDHLAPPNRIDPSLTAYVVWFSVPGHGVTRAGALDYDRDRRRGRLHATTPHSKFEVLISLENNRSASAPSERVVLRQLAGK